MIRTGITLWPPSGQSYTPDRLTVGQPLPRWVTHAEPGTERVVAVKQGRMGMGELEIALDFPEVGKEV